MCVRTLWRPASKRFFFSFTCDLLGLISLKFKSKEIYIKETKIKINAQNQKLEKKCDPVRLEIKNEISREFQKALEMETEQKQSTSVALNEVEQSLMDGQWDYCSVLVRPVKVVDREKDLLVCAAKQPLAHLQMEDGLRDIFKNDKPIFWTQISAGMGVWCGCIWNTGGCSSLFKHTREPRRRSSTHRQKSDTVSVQLWMLKDPIVNKVNKIRFCYIGFFVGGANSDLYVQ